MAATLPVVELVYPAEQDVQTVLPEAGLYEPAAQMAQPLGVDPEYVTDVPPKPAVHWLQSVMRVLPVPVVVYPVGQELGQPADSDACPVRAPYLPAAH